MPSAAAGGGVGPGLPFSVQVRFPGDREIGEMPLLLFPSPFLKPLEKGFLLISRLVKGYLPYLPISRRNGEVLGFLRGRLRCQVSYCPRTCVVVARARL